MEEGQGMGNQQATEKAGTSKTRARANWLLYQSGGLEAITLKLRINLEKAFETRMNNRSCGENEPGKAGNYKQIPKCKACHGRISQL